MVDASVILIIIVLVALSGLFSGLTLGLLGLDKTELERKIKLGSRKARKVYSVRKNGNLLLSTLLLGNVAVNSTLAVFLGSISTGLVAMVASTTLIVVFGEILPQATISRYALEVGAKTTWLVKIFIFILYPICWPISKGLDKMLGEEMPTIWTRHEIAEIIKHHEDSPHSRIDADEEKIILGALSFSNKIVSEIMTPRGVVYALESKIRLNEKTLKRIKRSAFTRFPVYNENINNIIGVLYAKDLIGINGIKKVRDVCRKRNILRVPPNKKLDVLLKLFLQKKVHFASVFNKYGDFIGVVTLEDIVEEVMRTEIVDEYDKVEDMQKMAKRKARKRNRKSSSKATV